jgi:hypothetical protein
MKVISLPSSCCMRHVYGDDQGIISQVSGQTVREGTLGPLSIQHESELSCQVFFPCSPAMSPASATAHIDCAFHFSQALYLSTCLSRAAVTLSPNPEATSSYWPCLKQLSTILMPEASRHHLMCPLQSSTHQRVTTHCTSLSLLRTGSSTLSVRQEPLCLCFCTRSSFASSPSKVD